MKTERTRTGERTFAFYAAFAHFCVTKVLLVVALLQGAIFMKHTRMTIDRAGQMVHFEPDSCGDKIPIATAEPEPGGG